MCKNVIEGGTAQKIMYALSTKLSGQWIEVGINLDQPAEADLTINTSHHPNRFKDCRFGQ
jgi:hypothetical protein